MKPLVVIARESPLSLLQVEELFALFPHLSYTVKGVQSFGDRHKQISLMDPFVADDFFTRELDQALLADEADIAVHSAKDLPYPLPAGLELYCLTEGKEKGDALVSRGGLTLARLPAGARVGTSSKLRKAELLQRRPDLEVVSIRGTIGERIAQVDAGQVDALIVAICALQRLGWSDRIAERLPFQTHPLQGNLAVVGRTGRPELKALFAAQDRRGRYGVVTLVGFGPGNPELLTVGGDRALATADRIFYDSLTNEAFLNRYPGEKIYVGKRSGNHSHSQEEIQEMLYQSALEGKATVRLKGGDPMLFAHGREEIDYLQSRFVEVRVIPGISTGIAFASCTHIPLTHRGLAASVAFVTGHAGSEAPVPEADTLVYYMAGAHVSEIAEKLLAKGWSADVPVALTCHVSLPDQQTFFSTLGELQYTCFRYPTPVVVVVGRVVGFEKKRSTEGPVLATGTRVDPKLAATTQVVHTPLIRITPRTLSAEERQQALALRQYDWILFTSRYGVRFYFRLLDEAGCDLRQLAGVRVASVGPETTAALRQHHIYPDWESPTGSAAGLVAYFRQLEVTGLRLLLPRSEKGLPSFSDALVQMGHHVTDLPIYHNTPNPEAGPIDLAPFRKILFSSPSGVEAFQHMYHTWPVGVPLVGKGKTTTDRLKTEIDETF